MMYDFECKSCLSVTSVKAPIGSVPATPYHCRRRTRRIWSVLRFQVQWGADDYANKAYLGDEVVPGLSTQEVRATIDTMTKSRS